MGSLKSRRKQEIPLTVSIVAAQGGSMPDSFEFGGNIVW
jgi:hypothetical protein